MVIYLPKYARTDKEKRPPLASDAFIEYYS